MNPSLHAQDPSPFMFSLIIVVGHVHVSPGLEHDPPLMVQSMGDPSFMDVQIGLSHASPVKKS